MAQTTVSTTFDNCSGSSSILTEQNALTLAGVALGAITIGGSAFVAAAVAPGHVIGGSLATGTLLVGGHIKKTTGSYFPFLDTKDDEVTPTPITAVSAA